MRILLLLLVTFTASAEVATYNAKDSTLSIPSLLVLSPTGEVLGYKDVSVKVGQISEVKAVEVKCESTQFSPVREVYTVVCR